LPDSRFIKALLIINYNISAFTQLTRGMKELRVRGVALR